ncbi:YihY family inner membrane protein [Phytohalomonas tamaricis]|uniref:YihY family inner membrane protein n=1 Tax=Phytohalomonas tamaricis TaxID=2081032 RepID=UPI00131A2764|nr:YihY family inner membrane protein [Phytohalomonas tamaricis]
MDKPQLLQNIQLPRAVIAMRELVKRFNSHDGKQTASALTYTTLFAVVPLTTVLYAMLAAIPNFQGVGDRLQQYVFSQFVPATGETVLGYLNSFTSQARNLTVVGVLFLFVTSVLMMITVERAFNNIWRVPNSRKGVSSFLLYWAMLTLGPILIGSGLVLSSYLTSLTFISNAASWVGGGKYFLRLVPPLLSFLAFLFIYLAVPNYRVQLRHAAAGAALVSVALEIAKLGFSLYVSNFPSYQVIYGAFAAVPLFLLWIYLSWAIILFGAELASWLGESQQADWRRWPCFWQAIGVLFRLQEVHLQGGTLTSKQLRRLLGGHYHLLLDPLMKAGFVAPVNDGGWVLSRSLDNLTLWEFSERLPWPIPLNDKVPDARFSDIARVLADERASRRQILDCPLGALTVPVNTDVKNK